MATGRGTGDTRRVTSPTLVGRGNELELAASAGSDPPAVVVVEGEAGVGKTRLVSELVGHPALAGRRVVVGACRRIREPFPLGPLLEMVRELGPELAAGELSPLAGALQPLLPEIGDVLPPPPPQLDDRDAERHRVFRALVEVFGAVGPVVLVVEDLHWADGHTLDLLSYLLDNPPAELSLVLTFRGEDVDPGVRTLTATLASTVRHCRVVLVPLDAARTGALAAAVLGVPRVSEEFAEYLRERTGGLPFAVEELLALLQARDKLRPRDDGWVRRALDELDVPTGVRDQILERVGRLSADASAVVEAAAVLQAPMPAQVIESTALVAPAQARRGLSEARESGVLVESSDQFGLRHALAAQAVYDSISGPRRRELHSRTVGALKALDPVPLGQVAHHLRQAGNVEAWVEAAEAAADQAVALGPDEAAARLLDDVLRHASLEVEQKVRLAVKLGRAAEGTSHSAAALGTLRSVLQEQPVPSRTRGELQFWLAMMLDMTDQNQSPLYRAAVAELDPSETELRTRALLGLANPTRAPGVPLADHKKWLSQGIELLPTGDRGLESFLLSKAAMVSVAMGDRGWRELLDRLTGYVDDADDPLFSANACGFAGYAALYAGHHEIADRLLTAGAARLSELGSRRVELKYRSILLASGYCRGAWDGLDEEAEVLLDSLAGYPSQYCDVVLVAGCLALARGNLAEARSQLTRVLDEAERLAGLDILPVAVAARVRLDLSSGDVTSARTAADELVSRLEIKGMWAPIARALPAITQATVESGQLADARTLVQRMAVELDGLDVPLAPPVLRHSRGVVELGANHWSAAASHFLAAAGEYEPLQCPYESAQVREEAARCLVAAGEAAGAEEQLRVAAAGYERLGASWDYGRAAKLAREHGIALPARYRHGRRGYGEELSPREREIARLAAAGRTNREIAEELYLSPRTVDTHLARIRRKLGVRSRVELAHRFGG